MTIFTSALRLIVALLTTALVSSSLAVLLWFGAFFALRPARNMVESAASVHTAALKNLDVVQISVAAALFTLLAGLALAFLAKIWRWRVNDASRLIGIVGGIGFGYVIWGGRSGTGLAGFLYDFGWPGVDEFLRVSCLSFAVVITFIVAGYAVLAIKMGK